MYPFEHAQMYPFERKFKSGIRTNAAAYWDLRKAGVFRPHTPAFVAKY